MHFLRFAPPRKNPKRALIEVQGVQAGLEYLSHLTYLSMFNRALECRNELGQLGKMSFGMLYTCDTLVR